MTPPPLYPIISAVMSVCIFLLKKLNISSKPARQKVGKYCILPPPPPEFFVKYADNYCVTAKKLILNVSKIRLRLIFSCALYLPRLFPKKRTPKSKQHNFFINNQLSHKTRKKDIPFCMVYIPKCPYGLGLVNPNYGRLSLPLTWRKLC